MELNNEIDLQRLLQRMQVSLANTSHSSCSEEECFKHWTYVEHAKELFYRYNT